MIIYQTIVYEKVKLPGQKTTKCSGCGKRLVRRKTFVRTINPFNTNDDGSIKNTHQILNELDAERAKWQRKSELCKFCGGGQT